MIKHLVSALLVLLMLLALSLCAGAHAAVIGYVTNTDGSLTLELHDSRGLCAEGLRYAQIVDKASKAIETKGCWTQGRAEGEDVIGVLWEGETEIRVAPIRVFHWITT